MSAPSDGPFLPRDLVARLMAAPMPLACAASGGWTHPVIGLWRTRVRDDLRRALTVEGERKIDRFTARHGCAAIEWPILGHDPFFNANAPEDLAEAEAILAREPDA